MTRATVLALSGWSNTQFSYWARRIEAISVLAPHDEQLRAVAAELEWRLKGNNEAEIECDDTNSSLRGRSETPMSLNSASGSSSSSQIRLESQQAQGVTGKGLDVIIEAVKRRTGASQFLRGKHSSLDPFGTIHSEIESKVGPEIPAPVYTPTFQAVEYSHTLPPSNPEQQGTKKKDRGKRERNANPKPVSELEHGYGPQSGLQIEGTPPPITFTVSASRGLMLPGANGLNAPLATPYTEASTSVPQPQSQCAAAMTSAQHNAPIHIRRQRKPSKEAEHTTTRRELFPVSDSRSELENMPHHIKRGGEPVESPPRKRTRQSEGMQ